MQKIVKDSLAQRIVDTLAVENGFGRSLMMAQDAVSAQKVFVLSLIHI